MFPKIIYRFFYEFINRFSIELGKNENINSLRNFVANICTYACTNCLTAVLLAAVVHLARASRFLVEFR